MRRPKKFLFDLIYDPDRLTGFIKLSAEKKARLYGHRREFKSRSPIIQRVSQLMVGDLGVLDGISRDGVTELSLNHRDIASVVNEVPAHGMAGVMGCVALDAVLAAFLV